jgi:regulator of replication initiation timing
MAPVGGGASVAKIVSEQIKDGIALAQGAQDASKELVKENKELELERDGLVKRLASLPAHLTDDSAHEVSIDMSMFNYKIVAQPYISRWQKFGMTLRYCLRRAFGSTRGLNSEEAHFDRYFDGPVSKNDGRLDYNQLVAAKHRPRYAFFKHIKWNSNTYKLEENELLVSLELLAQLCGQNVMQVGQDDLVIDEKIKHYATRMSTIQMDRYLVFRGFDVVQDTCSVASLKWRELKRKHTELGFLKAPESGGVVSHTVTGGMRLVWLILLLLVLVSVCYVWRVEDHFLQAVLRLAEPWAVTLKELLYPTPILGIQTLH